tara:strand:- start:430 stop:540 length:111 start_codon:yes stop_codon:yes gene_type:complete
MMVCFDDKFANPKSFRKFPIIGPVTKADSGMDDLCR